MMFWRCCTQYACKFGKLSSGHRIGKGQFSLQSQRRALTKNVQTTKIALILHVSQVMLKILQVSLQQFVNWELPDIQAAFRKGTRNQRSNYQHLLDHRESKGIPGNIYFCFIDYSKDFNCMYNHKLWKILKRWEYQTTSSET